ncbi:MAG: hypothetical protein HY079_07040 [Elusimicrobia bacterium]|nr:hypothetical protein [Elusimicrobiota bacterium]
MLDETLLKIVDLQKELKKVGKPHAEKATSAAGFAAAARHEASRKARSPKLLKTALQGLEHSAEELETTHPKIAAAILEICRELSSLGI